MAKREDSIYLFDKRRDAAIIASIRNVPAKDIFYNIVGAVLGGLMYCVVMKERKHL